MRNINNISKIWIFLLLSVCIISCNESPQRFYENDIKRIPIQGKIIKKYIDYDNHASTIIEFRDSQGHIKKYLPFYFYKLYEIVQEGDSICKLSGSLEYRIFRKDTVIKLYPVIDGDTLR
jgi:hypothetical protein